MAVIEVDRLTKDYGSGRGVFDVSFQIERGEVYGFLGPNGAGKSTTIRHIMGFSKPDKGATRVLGIESFNGYSRFLYKVGYIPGEIALPAGLSGYAFLEMLEDMRHIHNEERKKEMIALFELEDNILKSDVKKMSLGVKRKLAIVAASMHDPEVLILDEPTSGLDPIMQDVFIKFIKNEKARGKTILLSSHIFSEVDATCDRIGIIKDGYLVSEVVANDLKHASLKFYDVSFEKEEDYHEFLQYLTKHPEIKTSTQDEEKLSLVLQVEDKDVNALVEALSKFHLREFGNRRESLQDYFMHFYKEDQHFGGFLS